MEGRVGLGLVKKKDNVTVEELVKLFPKKKNTITEDTAKIINDTMNDPEFNGYSLIQTLVDYQGVMDNHKGNIGSYINAIRFCAFLESEADNVVGAYVKTFSNREFVMDRRNLEASSIGYRELTSSASRYRNSPMVKAILTQADVPLHLLFRGYSYKAIEVLMDKTLNSKLDRDQINAAKFLLEAIKPPENMKIELDVGVKENTAIEQLNNQLASIASKSLEQLDSGRTTLESLGAMKVSEDIIEVETE